MRISGKSALGLVVGGVILGSIVSVAAQETPAPTPGAEVAPRPKMHGLHHGGPKGAIRSESVYPGVDGGPVRTVRTDSGTLSKVDGNTLTISEADGKTVEVEVADATRIMRDGAEAKLADLEEGDHVTTVRTKEGDAAFTTEAVRAVSAERYAELEAQRAACRENPETCPHPGRGFGHRGWGPAPGPAGLPGDAVPAPAGTAV